MPLEEIEGCDGIFHGGVTNVGPTRLNGSSEVLSDPRNGLDQKIQSAEMEEWLRTNLGVPACTGVLPGAEIL